KSLHARCVPALRRRNPQRPRRHRLPAAPEGQPQRRLPGGVRAVRGDVSVTRLAPRAGFEPATIRLTVECSTAELPRNRRNLFATGERITKPRSLAKDEIGRSAVASRRAGN